MKIDLKAELTGSSFKGSRHPEHCL